MNGFIVLTLEFSLDATVAHQTSTDELILVVYLRMSTDTFRPTLHVSNSNATVAVLCIL